jgi:hypothetical protein
MFLQLSLLFALTAVGLAWTQVPVPYAAPQPLTRRDAPSLLPRFPHQANPPDWPSRERLRRWRGSLALDDRWGTWSYAGWDAARRAEFRARYKAAGYTHVALNFALDYHASDVVFDFRSDPEGFARRLEELLRDGLIPVLSLAQSETYGRFRRHEPIVEDLRRLLPIWRAYLPAVFSGWEHTDFLTPHANKAVLQTARELLPDAWIGIEFSREDGQAPLLWDSRVEDINDERQYYKVWLEGLVDGVLINMPLDVLQQRDRARFFDYLARSAARLAGPFEAPALFPWGDAIPAHVREGWRSPHALGLDVVYFEGPAYLKWPEDRKREWGTIAMAVPRISGYGDGGPPD